jgi:toxin-antitoxin system PIN domain toxin
MIAVDTNILVYAHREDSTWHEAALTQLVALAGSGAPWGIPWPCLHEFLAITSHPKIYRPPTPLGVAFDALSAWQQSPALRMLGEGPGYYEALEQMSRAAKIVGPKIHDARIAALCVHHGVRELWTADRDFSSFPALKCRNPLLEAKTSGG